MTICFSMRILIGRLGSTKEGVGETSGQAPDRGFEEFAPRTSFRQKKQVFLVRCGSRGPQLHRPSRPSVKSVPDVFADALVPGTLVPGTPRSRNALVSPGPRQADPSTGDGKKPPIMAVYFFLPGGVGLRKWFAIAM
jgi:hypothetical protein